MSEKKYIVLIELVPSDVVDEHREAEISVSIGEGRDWQPLDRFIGTRDEALVYVSEQLDLLPAKPATSATWCRLSPERSINTDHITSVQVMERLNRHQMRYFPAVAFISTVSQSMALLDDPAEVRSLAHFFGLHLPEPRPFTEADLDEGDEEYFDHRERLIELGRMTDPEKDHPCRHCNEPKHAHPLDICSQWAPAQAASEVDF